jgi:hypothetical protein
MFMFQIASSASNRPAPRPTRGSGLGAVVDIAADDILDVGDALYIGFCEQPVIPTNTTARSKVSTGWVKMDLPFIVGFWVRRTEGF